MGPEFVRIAQGCEEHPRNDSASIVELADGSLFMVWMEFLPSEWVSADEAPNRICSMVSRLEVLPMSSRSSRTPVPFRVLAS